LELEDAVGYSPRVQDGIVGLQDADKGSQRRDGTSDWG
jgi:hypothetical protein